MFTYPGLAKLSVPFSSGSALQREDIERHQSLLLYFQFPFPRDPPCNVTSAPRRSAPDKSVFQFPFPRDPPCNLYRPRASRSLNSFQFPFPRDPPCNVPSFGEIGVGIATFSSLFLGIRLATQEIYPPSRSACQSFSSLFLGIRLATWYCASVRTRKRKLSVPFSSGSALQPACEGSAREDCPRLSVPFSSGSALQLTRPAGTSARLERFQFPFPRDPPCNGYDIPLPLGCFVSFQFPFPRDPPCNYHRVWVVLTRTESLSVPFSSGSALQP